MSTAQTARGAREDFVHSSGFELLSRAGFVARGLIYGIVGILAFKLAVGAGGKVTDQEGALQTVARQPFGKVLLTLVAIGLGGYALWRLVRAALGRGPEGSDSGLDRVAAFASGIVYIALCILAVRVLTSGSGGSGSGSSPDSQTAGVLGWPAGTLIVGAAGLIMIGVGLYQGYRGITKEFLEDSKTEEMSAGMRQWISRIGMVGHLARMVVFMLVGYFLVKAAVQFDAQEAVGLDGALAEVVNGSYGKLLLGIVAVGLMAFAVYSVSDARYRRI